MGFRPLPSRDAARARRRGSPSLCRRRGGAREHQGSPGWAATRWTRPRSGTAQASSARRPTSWRRTPRCGIGKQRASRRAGCPGVSSGTADVRIRDRDRARGRTGRTQAARNLVRADELEVVDRLVVDRLGLPRHYGVGLSMCFVTTMSPGVMPPCTDSACSSVELSRSSASSRLDVLRISHVFDDRGSPRWPASYAPAKSNAHPQTTIPVSARKMNAHTQFAARKRLRTAEP